MHTVVIGLATMPTWLIVIFAFIRTAPTSKTLKLLLPFVAGATMMTMTTSNVYSALITLESSEDVESQANAIISADEVDNCPMGYFHCNTTSQCVVQRLNCDGQADCDDASDEQNCVNDVDSKFWDHYFRKQPFGRHDDIRIGECFWPAGNFSCPCRGNELLCRFQQLTTIPGNLPQHDVQTVDLTGNNFQQIEENFFQYLPSVDSLVLKFCSIQRIDSFAFKRLSEMPMRTLYLDENRIESLPQNLFPNGNNLRILILSGNRINVLHNYDFEQLNKLEELDLRGNRIETFQADVFEPMKNMEVLYLNENRIRCIEPGMFPLLQRLHTISLAQNEIDDIERNSFTFPHLRHLHLNDNKLSSFDLDAFACLENLTSLLLTGNDFNSLDPRVLQNLTNLNYIYFSWFHLCRAALHVRVCEPKGDGISSTHHLLDNRILRTSVWVMASVAVVGNLLVLLGRYFYKSRSNVEHSMYLRHLAASDFLMGIYLAIIACADIQFRGMYIFHEEAWRHSSWCAFSGFLSTFSCQSSTLLLTLVTWDRLMSVTRPLQPRDSGRGRIILRLLFLWGIAFALAAVPLMPNHYFGHYFYGTNGVCLSLHIHDPYARGWEYSAMLYICVNTFSLIFILISYIRMLQAIRDSGGGMRSTLSGREGVVATRFAIIVTTDCACWLPIIIVKLAALSGCPISQSLYAWLAVLVLPVNSALNPVLYTLTTAAFKQQLRRYCQTLPSCSLHAEQRSQTQTGFDSGLSISLGHFGSTHNASGRKRCIPQRMSQQHHV